MLEAQLPESHGLPRSRADRLENQRFLVVRIVISETIDSCGQYGLHVRFRVLYK